MNRTDERREGGHRILVVDDDEHTLDILNRWLSREGYRTTCADGGAACLEALAGQGEGDDEFDVILLDVMMPGMDGLQVCEEIHRNEKWRSIPIVLLTAKDDLETRARGMALGVSEYVTKPVHKKELLTRIEAQVRSRNRHRQLARTAESISKDSKA